MGFVGDIFSSDKGAGFDAKNANIQSPTNAAQASQATNQANSALAQQAAFTNMVNAQAPGAISTQNALSGMLMQQAQGGGPNPAQAALNQNTGNNVANQAALMAGQRGSSSNAGLIARQAGQQGAATQQNAVGQSATLQAGQQLAAQNALQGLTAGQMSQAQNANIAQNNASQGYQSNILNAIQGQNNANVSMVNSQNQANAGIAQGNQAAQSGLVSGLAKGLGGVFGGGLGMAHGGQVPRLAEGGAVPPPAPPISAAAPVAAPVSVEPIAAPQAQGPMSSVGQLLQNVAPKVDSGAPSGGGGAGTNSGAAAIAAQWNEVGKSMMPDKEAMTGMMGGGGGGGGEGGGGGGMMQSAMAAAPMLAMMSDERQKKDIQSGDPAIERFLDSMRAHAYKYKAGAGQDNKKHVSPMAQELEKSPVGKDLVEESPKGKMVDYSKSGPAILSSLANINTRLKELEMHKGGNVGDKLKAGGKVPGKAKVAGDSVKNDTVKALLSPDEIVLPRSITTAPDAPAQAAKFVAAVLARQSQKRAKK